MGWKKLSDQMSLENPGLQLFSHLHKDKYYNTSTIIWGLALCGVTESCSSEWAL